DGWTWKQDHRPRPETTPPTEDAAKKAVQAARRERTESLWADVKAITTPTLLMRGAISKILSDEAAEETVAAMTDAELVVIQDAGHSVQGDNPKAFVAELKAFIDRRGLR
ncbi:MAG: alpha/beta hydrolase, partial [Dehalococcoidia bacterium]